MVEGGARCDACAAWGARVAELADALALDAPSPLSPTSPPSPTSPSSPPSSPSCPALVSPTSNISHDVAVQVTVDSCNSSMQTEAVAEHAPQTDSQLQILVDELKMDLTSAERSHEEERQKLTELIR